MKKKLKCLSEVLLSALRGSMRDRQGCGEPRVVDFVRGAGASGTAARRIEVVRV